MIEKEFKFKYQIFEDFSELPGHAQKLMKSAINARNKAYAPYSKFQVGAALYLNNDETVTGSNQENASYPSGLCAERTAIYAAGANYPEAKIEALAITATSQKHKVLEPIAPCGACRQAIAEYEKKQNSPIVIYFMGESGKIIMVNALLDILPLAFDNKFL
ncbi:cytidine deaminase [Psychroflexus aestuariivivens]|uniref:cytidine deaminase n=1 Tax=Psychroflexus aestuariivivens TaxID=1795040 RepID=UPI000FDA5981|nr:cytidine deaminase [Psychroflexus aestuariivivens]